MVIKMKQYIKYVFIGISIILCFGMMKPVWGFYGHRWINRMAVFTLPSEMIGIFKEHIEFITEHAVDPDKRRYATKHEAVRHYIDIDHWGTYPFENVPRKWGDAIAQNLKFQCVSERGDTTLLFDAHDQYWGKKDLKENAEYQSILQFTYKKVLPGYYDDPWVFEKDTITQYLPEAANWPCSQVLVNENFSEYGIIPYHLLVMQRRLTKAFEDKNLKSILRTATEMGHYIGDAHVPLHTTENYNGQLTGQEGIHAFWESRIPELFAEENYDFWVGQASYIDNPAEYFWEVVLKSHSYVEEVFRAEWELRSSFSADQQLCFDERLGRTVLTQCKEFAAAYEASLQGMIEERMVATVSSLGDVWYTAWIDAGQPDLDQLKSNLALSEAEKAALEALEAEYKAGDAKGRKHEND